MKKTKKNSTPSTKWRASGSGLTLSRLCRWLALAIAVKLAVFFSLAGSFNSPAPQTASVTNAQEAESGINLPVLPGLNQAQAQDGGDALPLPMTNATATPPPGRRDRSREQRRRARRAKRRHA